MKDFLIQKLQKKPAVFSFLSDPLFSGQVVSYIIKNEIGTYRDQLFPFLYDPLSKRAIERSEISAELIQVHEKMGVAVGVQGLSSLAVKLSGFRALLNPRSFSEDGCINRCIFFPESIAKIAALQEAELVIVRDWAISDLSILDEEYDPLEERKQAIHNRDGVIFAGLLKESQLPFMGTHDIVAHIAGIDKTAIKKLATQAKRVHKVLTNYFEGIVNPNQASLILAFTIGVMLDRLAQPPNYKAKAADIILEKLLDVVERRQFSAQEFFPRHYDTLMETAFFMQEDHAMEEKTQEMTDLYLNELKSLFKTTHETDMD